MSYAGVEIWSPDGKLLGFSVYQGSVSMIRPEVSETLDHAWGIHDRTADPLPSWDQECDCSPEPCIIFSDYAGGNHWPGTWCPKCRTVLDGVSEYEPDYGYSQPTPKERAYWDAFRAAGWPKAGHPFPGQGGHYGKAFAGEVANVD